MGILVKKEIQFNIVTGNDELFGQGRCIGIETGQHRIFVVYLPVSSGEADQINLCYEGIS